VVRVVVTGSRGWSDIAAVHNRLLRFPQGTTIVHGDAREGADRIADSQARMLGLEVERHPARWKLGKKAGPLRNREMLETRPDLVLAFWDGESRGTKDCMDEAARRGIPLEVVTQT
jgi:YspA, cpYpsA-related SLOG family